MPANFHQIMGIAAGLIGFLALFPYMRSILKGTTKPNRASWLLWTIVGAIIAASYRASGADTTMWLAIIFAVNSFVIFLFAVKYGVGGWAPLDRVCLLVALGSLVFWFAFGSPETTFAINLTVDFLASVPTIKKTWHNPEQENKAGWVIITIASAFNVLAIDQLTWRIALYPIYGAVMCGAMVALLFLHKPKQPALI